MVYFWFNSFENQILISIIILISDCATPIFYSIEETKEDGDDNSD